MPKTYFLSLYKARSETLRHEGKMFEIERLRVHKYVSEDGAVILRHNQRARIASDSLPEFPCFLLTLFKTSKTSSPIELCTIQLFVIDSEVYRKIIFGSQRTAFEEYEVAYDALDLARAFLRTLHAFIDNEHE